MKKERLIPAGKSLWVLLFIITVLFFFYPINIGIMRTFLLISVPMLIVASIIFLWKYKTVRYLPLAIVFFVIVFICLPGRAPDVEKLRLGYVDSMKAFEGTRYIWGGENIFGIDCSGLIRKGLINTCFWQGLSTANPSLTRYSFNLWWNDCSARRLGEGYDGRTIPVFKAPSINSMRQDELQAGDIAITSDGIHVLAYLGKGEWIEADPSIRKVICAKPPVKDNSWFDARVQVMRWEILK